MSEISKDLAEMSKKLKEYVDNGREVGYREVGRELEITIKPDRAKIQPLETMKDCDAQFLAVDCSTRTLKRANNWGVYLLRTAYASVKARNIDWGYEERIRSVVGDVKTRYRFLEDARVELESVTALDLLREGGKVDYLLLDGASHFGGERKFRTFLYEKCEREGITLLAISKQSQTLHDEKGRDFMAMMYGLSPYDVWVYHPVKEANVHEHLYGDIAIIKLCEDSPRVFRCDIMGYLLREGGKVPGILSPLTSVCEDPRCLGYPVTLWLAHDFSTPSNSKLLHYKYQIEETWADAGLLDILHMEELVCNFPDELHGVRNPFEWEWISHV